MMRKWKRFWKRFLSQLKEDSLRRKRLMFYYVIDSQSHTLLLGKDDGERENYKENRRKGN